MHRPSRALLLHISACFDVNECELDVLQIKRDGREGSLNSLYRAIYLEAIQLGDTGSFSIDQLLSAFSMHHTEMQDDLKKNGRRYPHQALNLCKACNNQISFSSPKELRKVAHHDILSQD